MFQFHGITIHTYGLFVATGVLAGIFFAKHEAGRIGLDPEKIVDLCFYIVIAAIVGSRIFYVITNLKIFLNDPLEIFKIWNGGLVFYGGFIGAALVAVIYLRMYRLPLAKTADVAALSLPLGHFFGRLGCFSAGCCYGKACHEPWAVHFSNPNSLVPLHYLNTPLHPTQLYSSAANLSIFLFLLFYRRKKRFDGQLFWIYMLLYGTLRSLIEVFRNDFRGAVIFNIFSISQAVGLTSAIIAIIMLIILSRRARRAAS